jgi:hypothetical protein
VEAFRNKALVDRDVPLGNGFDQSRRAARNAIGA